MRTVIIGLILLALLAAGGTAFLVKRFLDAQTRAQAQAEAQVQARKPAATTMVLVADRNLPAGTTITPGALRWQPWPEDAVGKNYVVSPDKDKNLEKQFVGAVVRRGVPEATPLIAPMVFKREQPGFLAGALEPGMRAVSVAVTAVSGAAGFILPGDRVDVILTQDVSKVLPKSQTEGPVIGGSLLRFTSDTVLRNVRVLAVDQKVDEFDQKAAVVKTVTIEVSQKQGEALAVALAMGQISLALRSLATDVDQDDPRSFTTDLEVSPTLSSTVGKMAAPAKGKSPAGDAAKPSAPAAETAAKVKIYRGGQATTQEIPPR